MLSLVRKTISSIKSATSSIIQKEQKSAQNSQQIEWKQPKELAALSPSNYAYPIDDVPVRLRKAILEVVDYMQCPTSLAACSAFSVLSLAGQGLVDVMRDKVLKGPVSLYILIIAESGERKSATDKQFSSPVKAWEEIQEDLVEEEIERTQGELAAWQAKQDGLRSAIKAAVKSRKPTDSLEEELKKHSFEKPHFPKAPVLSLDDSTTEAAAISLAKHWPYSGILADEAGIVFGGHSMNADTAMRHMAQLNKLWDGASLKVKRATKESFRVGKHCRFTMGLSSQPDTLNIFMSSSKGLAKGIGFFARFLITYPDSTQGYRLYKAPTEDSPHLDNYHKRITELLELQLKRNRDNQLEPTALTLSNKAKSIWTEFFNQTENELKPHGSLTDINDTVCKIADNAARLAALFHLFDTGIEGEISGEHMSSATEIVGWHLHETKKVFGSIQESQHISYAKTLDKWLRKRCIDNNLYEVSTRDAQRHCHHTLRKRENLDLAFSTLEKLDRIKVIKKGNERVIKINPSLIQH